MPDTNSKQFGLALYCKADGKISKIVKDELGLTGEYQAVNSFFDLINEADHFKAERFLSSIWQEQAALDWEINVPMDDKVRILHFSGVRQESSILVVGSTSHEHTHFYMEKLMELNNQQINDFRSKIKSDYDSKKKSGEELYDDFTQLNNELANARREIEKKNAELESLNKIKDQFIGMAAHDLRNPLGAIYSLSQMLLDDESADRLTEEQKGFINDIRESSEFTLQLVEDLLEVNRIKQGQLNLSIQKVNPEQILWQNVRSLEKLADKKNIKLQVNTGEAIPQVELDPNKFKQVLNNLITNAIKYSYPESTVYVTMESEEGSLRISVLDEGQGISKEEKDKLFEPFATTSAKATGGEKSTGLGLTITKKIVEGHKGRIEVDSEVDKGSRFTVTLPLEQAQRQT